MDGKIKRSRRSRSQRDRVRRRDAIDNNVQNRSLSSGSERGQSPFRNKALRNYGKYTNLHRDRPPRPPRKKRRGSVCQEEDIIDGFAIVSFLSLDNIELALRKRTTSVRSREGKETWERQVLKREKTERALVPVNGFGDNGADVEPEQEVEKKRGKLKTYSKKNKQAKGIHKRQSKAVEVTRVLSLPQRSASNDRHSESSLSGRGYSCDSENDIDDKVSGVESDKLFTLRIKSDCPADQTEAEVCIPGRVSGLQRSQEQSSDAAFSLPASSPAPAASQPAASPAPATAPDSTQTTPPPLVCVKKECSSPRVPTSTTPQGPAQVKREPQVPSSHPQNRSLYTGLQSSHGGAIDGSRKRTHPQSPRLGHHSSPSPALPLSITEVPSPHYFLPGPSHRRPAMFASPLSLPSNNITGHPAGTGYSEHDLLRQELNKRYLAQSAERGAGPGSHLRAEFHQHTHQHQHQHQHTHQHTFTPYSPCGPPAGILATPPDPSMGRTAALNLEKYPVKLENPYSNFIPSYPPEMPGMSALLPQSGPFSSLRGAFQPKANPMEVPTRPGDVPRTLPRITDPFRASSRKAGRWCAMHSQIAWQIHHHQQRIRHMRVDPHKLNMKLDLFSRPAGPSLPPGLSYSHDLTRPLLSSSGHLPASPFSSPYHHPHYLSTSHLPDPFSRPSNYGGLVNMASNVFGGLGAPSSSPFSGRQGHGLPGFGGPPQEGWNRLHRTPPSFPTPPPLAKPADVDRKPAVLNTEKERNAKKRDFTATKEESDRDWTSQERNPRPSHSSSSSYQISSLIGSSGSKRSSPDHGPEREGMLLGRVQIKQCSSPGPEVQDRGPSDLATARGQSSNEPPCPMRGPANIKQERRDESELAAGTSNITLLLPSGPPQPHSQHPSRRNNFPAAGVFQGSHLPHSLPLSMSPLHPVSSLSALERARVQPFMGVSPLAASRECVASHLSTPWEPLRAPYRGLYQQNQQPHNFDPARGHRQREPHPQERHRQAEERARLHQLQGSPMEGHLAHHTSTFMSSLGGVMYPRLSPSAPHSGHLNRTPPAATLGAPPPLVPTATSQPAAIPRRTTPTGSATPSGDLAPSCTPKQVEAL